MHQWLFKTRLNHVFSELSLVCLLLALLLILKSSQAFYRFGLSTPTFRWLVIVVILHCSSEEALCAGNSTWPMFQPIVWHQSGKQLRFNQSLVTKTRKQHMGLSLVLYYCCMHVKPLYINQLENSIGECNNVFSWTVDQTVTGDFLTRVSLWCDSAWLTRCSASTYLLSPLMS